MGGQSKWETLHLRIKTDDGFTIEYHEKDSHNADVRFESETYEKSKKYLYDALFNYPHFYRVEEKEEHLEYNKQQLIIADVMHCPDELEPVLAKIEHINDLGKSKWYEVVCFYGSWLSYSGSKTFEDGERVVKWQYCKDCV
jgi:hypothetical protein